MSRKHNATPQEAEERGLETARGGDQSPRFRKLSDEESLALLLEARGELPDHALDSAPINSKIIVVIDRSIPDKHRRRAVIATPDGVMRLPENDPAHRLPEATKLYRTPAGHFQLRLPKPYDTVRPLNAGRAADLIDLANHIVAGTREDPTKDTEN